MDHCKEFARYLVEEKHVSDNTLDSYRRDTEHFLSFLSSVRNVDPLSVKVEDIKTRDLVFMIPQERFHGYQKCCVYSQLFPISDCYGPDR